jgi:hypothetical protein
VSYATLGNGHASHVAVETLARAAGVQMLHVPFKDAGTLLTAWPGEVDFTTFGMNTVAGLVASGPAAPAGGGRPAAAGQPPGHSDAGRGRRPAGRDAPLGRAGGGGRHAAAGAGAAAAAHQGHAGGRARRQREGVSSSVHHTATAAVVPAVTENGNSTFIGRRWK